MPQIDPPGRRVRLMIASGAIAMALVGCAGAASLPPLPSGGVEVQARDYAFAPDKLAVPTGSVTFRVHNVGTELHEFEILQGDQVIDEVEGLTPGLAKDLTVTLAAGDYVYVCRLADHEQRGMKGTLTVTP